MTIKAANLPQGHLDWLSPGQGGWRLVTSSMTAISAVPGLVLLYAGLTRTNWGVNTSFMVLYAFATVMVCWGAFAFQMSFGIEMIPGLVGWPGLALGPGGWFESNSTSEQSAPKKIALIGPIAFHFAFASITMIQTAGPLLARTKFIAWMIFVPTWITLSYTVCAFSIWGHGWLYQRGALDFAGGFVLHVASGTAGFVASAWVGPRYSQNRRSMRASSLLLGFVGASLLWVGETGFNGGGLIKSSPKILPNTDLAQEFEAMLQEKAKMDLADPNSAISVLNTHMCTAVSLLVWTWLDSLWHGRASMYGAIHRMISGMVAIAPGSGLVPTWSSFVIGVIGSFVPWFTQNFLNKAIPCLDKIDDPMQVFHTRIVAGLVGGILVGIFATEEACFESGALSPGGAIEGNPIQVVEQLIAFFFVVTWNIVWTSVICLFIKYVCRVPLRYDDKTLKYGDELAHGDTNYFFQEDVEAAIKLSPQSSSTSSCSSSTTSSGSSTPDKSTARSKSRNLGRSRTVKRPRVVKRPRLWGRTKSLGRRGWQDSRSESRVWMQGD